MIGIVSYGGYIPRLRLNRMAIYRHMGWFAPALVTVAQGERSFCNWDEDVLTLAVEAGRNCLRGRDRSRVDGHYLCSTSFPFTDRLNAGISKEALNLRDDLPAMDFSSSQRCGTSALLTALDVVKGGSCGEVLLAAADKRPTRPASFYEMWYGDGAAALLLGSENVLAEYLGGVSLAKDFVGHYRGAGRDFDYTWEERWIRDEGYSKIIPEAVGALFEKLSITMEDVDHLVFPCFFKAEHRKIAKKLGAGPEKLIDNLHEVCGETGAAHPLVMLCHALETAKPGERILLCGFGQGADALLFRVTDEIASRERGAFLRTLENGCATENYMKFLKFRDLIDPEMGIRAEAPTQTAMTVLYRNRKMLHGLIGGKCASCGTAQFPKMDICVNPDCRATGTQTEHPFADEPARVKSFTADLLAVSVDPPAIYGMVEFENGGRFMADFTDVEKEDVAVGQPVRMVFRKRYTDKERGFSGYFWKALPILQKKTETGASRSSDFDDRVAVVTGAGAGLGRVYALELAARGCKVVVNDLGGAADGRGDSKNAADAVVEEIRQAGGEAVASYDSVATPEGGEAIINAALSAFGRIDIVINNAGILRDRSFLKLGPEDWKAVLDVHLAGAYHVTRPAFAKMREQGYGRIVFTTSAAGLFGNFGQTNYSAAKLGLVGLMNSLKLEGLKYDIKVNTVAPIARTRLTEDILPPDLLERMRPEFVAPLVLYLCREDCEESGQVFNAAMGYYNRSAIFTGPGAVVGDGRTPPTPEDIHRHFDAIHDLGNAREYHNLTEALNPMIDAFESGPADGNGGGSSEPGGVAAIFKRMPEAFQADKSEGVSAVFQYVIGGDGGGEWFVTVKEQTCSVQKGRADAADTTIKMDGADFLALMQGKANAMNLFTTGKLKVEGDMMKSQLIGKLFRF